MTEPRVAEAAPLPAGRIRTVGVLVLLVLAALLWYEPAWLTRMQAAGFDAFQARKPRGESSHAALIVEVDEKSIAALGQWPWPRTVFARIVRNVARGHPAAIGIDILMTEPDRLSPARALEEAGAADPILVERIASLPSNDFVLASAITGTPSVLALVGTAETTGAKMIATPVPIHGVRGEPPSIGALGFARYSGVLGNVAEIDRASAGRGIVSNIESGSVIRRMPLIFDINGTPAPAFAVEMLRVAERAGRVDVFADPGFVYGVKVGERAISSDHEGALRLYFAPHDSRRYVSAVDVYSGKTDSTLFTDRFVVIGVTGVGLAELQGTPLGEQMPAVEVQAQVIENMLDRTWLQRPASARILEVALFMVLGGLLIWVTPRYAPRDTAIVALACVAVPLAAAYAAFRVDRWIFDAVTPGVMLLLLFLVLLFLTLRDATRQRKALEQVLQRSRENAARVAGEFAAAQRIQTGLLPSPSMLAGERRVELAASMTPAREVGGDLYDFFRLDNRRLFFVVGDVAGKGLSASIFMAVSKALYKSLALRTHDSDVGALMAEANREVSRDNPEMLFVTAFAGVLDLESGDLAYCNAGHENPYVANPAGAAVVRIEDGGGPPLCAVDDYVYRGAERRLRAGEFLCLVSDGVTEAVDPRGELYGGERVREFLKRAVGPGATAGALVTGLRGDVDAFSAGAEAADDLTVLVLRWNGPREVGLEGRRIVSDPA